MLVEKVQLPEKAITEADIVKQPLWHEYEGWEPPRDRSQIIKSEFKQVTNAERCVPELNDNEAWRGAGTGFSAGRGKTIQKTSCPDTNIQPSTGGCGLKNGNGRTSYPNRGQDFTQRLSSYDSYSTHSRFQPSRAAKDSSSGPSYVAQCWNGEPSKSSQASWRRNQQESRSGTSSNTGNQLGSRGWWSPRNAPSTNQGYVPVPVGTGRGRGSTETPSVVDSTGRGRGSTETPSVVDRSWGRGVS